ncbi:hypothetical protein FO519_007596 [Halicephalobus sp. NKZ332]|nr:hypothetical protein FO519_007596 [Halicephalobus sp. NKZ332]
MEEVEVPDEKEEFEADVYLPNLNSSFESSMLKTRIHEKDVVSVAISPNGKWVATGSCDDLGCLFNLDTSYKVPHAAVQANESISDIAFSPDSRFVAFVAATEIYVIDLEKPRPPMTYTHVAEFSLVQWWVTANNDGPGLQYYLILTVPLENMIVSFEVTNHLEPVSHYFHSHDEPSTICFNPGSNVLLISFKDDHVIFLDIHELKPLSSLKLRSYVTDAVVGPNGEYYASMYDGQVALLTQSEDKCKAAYFGDPDQEVPSSCLAVHQNETASFLAVGNLEGRIQIFNLRSQSQRFSFATNSSILSLKFNKSGSLLFAGTFTGHLFVLDVMSGALVDCLHSMHDISTFAYDVKFFDDHTLTCAVNAKGELRYLLTTMAYQMYRSTTLGEALEHVLEDCQKDGTLPPSLVKRVMDVFDKSFTSALSTKVKNRFSYKANKLRAYRFCDNVWTFVIEDVNIRDLNTKGTMHANHLKIVACDANRKP